MTRFVLQQYDTDVIGDFTFCSDHPRHPADGHGGSADPGGHACSHRMEPHRPHQVFTVCWSCCQGRIFWGGAKKQVVKPLFGFCFE